MDFDNLNNCSDCGDFHGLNKFGICGCCWSNMDESQRHALLDDGAAPRIPDIIHNHAYHTAQTTYNPPRNRIADFLVWASAVAVGVLVAIAAAKWRHWI